MSKYSPEELDRIKRETDLPALVRARGVVLKQQGKDLVGLCPFHNDTTPSLVLTFKDGMWQWHCLGACNTGGESIAWVQKDRGVSFRHAVEILHNGNGNGTEPAVWDKVVKKSTVPHLESPLDLSVDDRKLLRQVIEYYHQRLKQTPAALSYLAARGLSHSEMIDRFQLGYADRTLGLRLPLKNRKDGAEIRQRLIELGILRSSGHEHFNGSLVIPVMSEQGLITEVYGRKINDNLRPGTPQHLYLSGPHQGIFNPAALHHGKVILCEALIDALTFWVNGFHNVTASYGVGGFTEEMLAAFLTNRIEAVYLAYDRDEAGDRAAEQLAVKLMENGIACFRVHFPRGLDANAYALKVTPAEKSLQVLLNSAVWMGNGAKGSVVVPVTEDIRDEESNSETSPSPETTAIPITPTEQPADPSDDLSSSAADPSPTTPPAAPCRIDQDRIEMVFDDRHYRIVGLSRNMAHGSMKVNMRVMAGDRFHVDTFDVYSYRSRSSFIQVAALELGTADDLLKADLGQVLLKLEELQEEQIKRVQDPKKKEVVLSDEERRNALAFLKKPDLLGAILRDFERCGVVGETTNKLIGYLACVSRNLYRPLGIIIQSSSAAGKTYLMEALLSFIPKEYWQKYSAMTGQSLFYMGETDLKYKILAIVEEEGAERASYPLKLLQSEGELTIASTGKDPVTGRLVTHQYRIEGPVVIIITTTNIEIDEELQNRCIILTVNEDRDQTRAIHKLQRDLETLEGHRVQQEWQAIRAVHQNAQRLLRPLTVVNPYAPQLTFLDTKTRTRRDHVKYLTLMKSIALLHQFQREIKTDVHRKRATQYVEVTLEDIEIANRLAAEALGRSLDELTPQTRRFLMLLDDYVKQASARLGQERQDFRFTRRAVREHTGWSYDQVRIHLERLIDLEYILVHRGSRGQQFVYELLYDGKGKDGQPFLMGLLDVDALKKKKNDGK